MDEGFLTVASEAALKAGGILRENIHGIREITFKGDINLVTEMDMRSERAVVETLLASFPGHGIIAEEETRIQQRVRVYLDHRPAGRHHELCARLSVFFRVHSP